MIQTVTFEMLMGSPGAEAALGSVQERLDYCQDYLAPLTLVGLYVHDVPLGTGKLLNDEMRTRLLQRAKTLIQRSVRSSANERRKVTDAVWRLDPLFVAVLCNASKKNHHIPLGRILEALRQSTFAGETGGKSAFRRKVVVGSVSWEPGMGLVRPEELFEKMLEAVARAAETPCIQDHALLGIGLTAYDQIHFYEHPWGEARTRLVEAIPRSATAPIARGASGPVGRAGNIPVVRSVTGPVKEEKKPFWRFW